VFYELQKRLPEITLLGDVSGELLGEAMATKDADEIERIRRMGQLTTEVVGKAADFLTGQAVRDGVLVLPDGSPLTVGRVKGLIDLWLAERGAENPEGAIFAVGRDGGVPHSSGNPRDALRLGQPIVFDIFPCEAGGGYFYDLTRTWCLGYAPEAVQAAYEQVLRVYETVTSELKTGLAFNHFQRRACDLFEAMGHPTIQSSPDTEEGYVHGLGHGVGLKIHERPFSRETALAADVLQPGMVVTVEPGLYYPERGYGVRLENTFAILADGRFEVLADYPFDLVLPVR
jgi:Xaa-Pro aminopeptidase